LLKASKADIYFMSMVVSSIITGSECKVGRDNVVGSKAPDVMKVGETIGASDFIEWTVCDGLGKGLCIGGVGGALLHENGSMKGLDCVVGVPYVDEGEVWPCSESELTDPRR
jgi:hypothetical protein